MHERETLEKVRDAVQKLYEGRAREVPFHGWHHVDFVARKSLVFARELGAVEWLTVAAAYTHDLNYLVNTRTGAAAGSQLRTEILEGVGVGAESVTRIDAIVLEAETAVRGAEISREAQALSDADTLFKALPITPIILAPLFMQETGLSLRELAKKITSEQVPLRDQEIYFYSSSARERYGLWGDVNLRLWQHLMVALDDPDVAMVLGALGVDS